MKTTEIKANRIKTSNENVCEPILQQLFAMQDLQYRDFHSKLIPNIEKEKIIGVRTPVLRKYAKRLQKEQPVQVAKFMSMLPHVYYEENMLHGFLIEEIKDYELCMEQIEAYLPYIDNWAVCDLVSPKALKNHSAELEKKIVGWMQSTKTYTIRYGIGMLMRYYLEEQFQEQYLCMVCDVVSEEYYVNMMRAWFFATALAKQWDTTLPFITEQKLDQWTHNKTIQKAVESNRISKEQKTYLRGLRLKMKT